MPRLTDIFPDRSQSSVDDTPRPRASQSHANADNAWVKVPSWGERLKQSREAGMVFAALGLVVCVLLLLVGSWSWRTGRLDLLALNIKTMGLELSGGLGLRVQSIRLEGADRTQKADLNQLLSYVDHKPLLSVDPGVLKSHVENLPWVNDARIQRAFPNTLVIGIDERKPAAIWQYNHALALIDHKGDTIAGADVAKFAHLPLMVGAEVPKEAEYFLALLDQRPDLKPYVKAAVLISGRRWDLQLGTHMRVKLPAQGLDVALDRLAQLQHHYDLINRDVAVVDLRLDDRMILRLGDKEAGEILLNRSGPAV